ncbi:protein shisa-5 [Hippoglossus stenolepis]|uniref:protein shisa-5 n=1 Tax=Hippoglossus stenolepis TaxID=195615 RepID=UPI00159C17B9|nr:protein shisa-5 [Hippoglossus stenolepis]
MASGLCGVVVLVLCAFLAHNVFARDSDCDSYTDLSNVYHAHKTCYRGFCCGTCYNRYCCQDTFSYLSESKQEDCYVPSLVTYTSPFHMIIGIVSLVIVLLTLICCCVCPCCCLYKICRKPRPVVATTTHTTVISSTPLNYPQQPTATPGHPQSFQGPQYQPYQPVPVQPGYGSQPMPQAYGAQPMPQAYGAQPMPPVPYQGQPFTPGPPPTYQEATGPTYPPNPMPYSQAAFSPSQPAYPPQPPAQPGPNAPLAHTDFLTQPAYNPEYIAPRTG